MAVLIGILAIWWYSYLASTSFFRDLKNAERDAAETRNPIVVNAMVGIRTRFENHGLGVGYISGLCLVGVGVGLAVAIVRMFWSPGIRVERWASMIMRIALAFQMGALWLAALLALLFLFFLADLVAF